LVMKFLRAHWKMLLVFVVGVFFMSPLPHSIYVRLSESYVRLSGNAAVPGSTIAKSTAANAEAQQGEQAKPEGRATETKTTIQEESSARPGEGEDHAESLASKLAVLREKLGEALIIAAVLGIVVDEAVKRSLVKEVLENVLYYAVGYELPDEVKEQLKYILRLPFVRRNFKIVYTFTRIDVPGTDGKPVSCWQIDSETEYEVDNLTDTQKFYEFRSSIELGQSGLAVENRLMAMEVPSLNIKMDESDVAQISHVKGPYNIASLPIHIRPNKRGPVLVKTRRLGYYPLHDTMVLDILEPPCLGLKVCVAAPPEIEVTVAFGVPGEVKPIPEDGRQCWPHEGVHLPGTHFRVSWTKAKSFNTAGAPAAAV
jgi:hypothetical protein